MSEIKAFEHQVAGHHFKKKVKTLLIDKDYVYKPVGSEREKQFYENQLPNFKEFQSLVPKYYGSKKIKYKDTEEDYFILENLTKGFLKPNILDIKVGQRTYDEQASKEKIKQEIDKYPPQEKIGFRFSGMKIYENGEPKKFDRHWASKFDEITIKDGFIAFFTDNGELRKDLMKKCLVELEKIKQVFEKQKQFRFYASSILIIYENNEILVKSIDFAHVFEIKDDGLDSGYLYGVKNIIKLINMII